MCWSSFLCGDHPHGFFIHHSFRIFFNPPLMIHTIHYNLHILKEEWMKIMGYGDCLPIHQVAQICSIHRKLFTCNHLMDGQTTFKTHDFSSTISLEYVH